MEECRAECSGIYLCTNLELLKIFGYHDKEAEDIYYINWLIMCRAGVRALVNKKNFFFKFLHSFNLKGILLSSKSKMGTSSYASSFCYFKSFVRSRRRISPN